MQRLAKWTETYARLKKTDQQDPLEPKELETFALAAYLTGRDSEGFQLLDRAHQDYLNRKRTKPAVRCAFWLALMLRNAGETARSSGWMSRAERLLTDEADEQACAEQGLLLLPAALGTLAAGDADRAQKLFEQMAAIGSQFGDADLIALGRLGHGQAIIQQGHVAQGIKLLDETMITIETEEVYPVVGGIVYCAVIETCRKVWDLRRAQEWTSALTQWCDAQQDIVPFRGQCLIRRAEIIQFHGEWIQALEETRNACKLLTRSSGGTAAGEGYYREAELHRLLGAFEAAEDCYREAAKWGRKPQPGLALLRLAQGKKDVAVTSIKNTLQETKDMKRRAELLPEVVHILVAVKQTEEALEASKELSDIAEKVDVPYLYAMSAYCQGAVFLAQGALQPALERLQKALTLWNTLQLPYEAARSRVLKGIAYREMKDKDNAEVELAAAKWVFEQLKAVPDLERVNRLLNNKRHYKTHGLTLRELQVLRRVASGKTNKFVAGELFISERTVDRHVSNIFSKLGVSSRVAATAFALREKLLDNPL